MSLTGILLGVLDVLVLVVILVLIGAIIMWVLSSLGWPVPANVQKLYMAVVALIALIALISLLLGVPRVHILASQAAVAMPALLHA